MTYDRPKALYSASNWAEQWLGRGLCVKYTGNLSTSPFREADFFFFVRLVGALEW